MKIAFVLSGIILILALGCARLRVEAPKEPIKVDISMRLDIYQHIEKDIDAIESIVSGSKEKSKAKDDPILLNYFVSCAYAQENLNPEIEQAALRRKDRYPELVSLEQNGVVGENKSGLVEIKDAGAAGSSAQQLVSAENNDRMIIYQAVARKNETLIEEVQKIYAQRLQNDASVGTPIEVLNETTGAYEWKIK